MVTVVERAQRDIEDGRLWKARDRLAGALVHRQDNEVVSLLATVHQLMGDLPAAGALWFVLERDDDDTRQSLEAWRERYPTSDQQARSIPGPLRPWRRDPSILATPIVDNPDPDWRERAGEAVAILIVVVVLGVVLGLLGVGGWTVAGWLLH